VSKEISIEQIEGIGNIDKSMMQSRLRGGAEELSALKIRKA